MLNEMSAPALRPLVILACSALGYFLMTGMMRLVSRRLTKRFRTTSPDTAPRIRSASRLARVVLLIAFFMIDLRLILPQLVQGLGISLAWVAKLTAIALITTAALLLYWVLLLVLGGLGHAVADGVDDFGELVNRTRTISTVIRSTAVVLIVVVASMMMLRVFAIDISPVLAGAGIAGLAISLGAQSLVQDSLGGLFVLVEDHFRVGDYIEAAGLNGKVERISLRSTWLRSINGTMHIIPNGEMRIVSNRNRGWVRTIIDIRIPYDEDIENAESLLRELATEIVQEEQFAEIVREEPAVLSVAELAESWVTMKVLLVTDAGKQYVISRDLQKRIVKAFKQQGIRFAYPRSVVRVTQDAPLE